MLQKFTNSLKLLLSTILIFTVFIATFYPVKANTTSRKISSFQLFETNLQLYAEWINLGENKGIAKLHGRVSNGFHIYSVEHQGKFSPEPTTFYLDDKRVIPSDELKESTTSEVNDEAFGMRLRVHKGDFWISRQFTVMESLIGTRKPVHGMFIYQICSEKICSLPIRKEFELLIYD